MECTKLQVGRYLGVSCLDQNPWFQEEETLAFVERRGWHLVDHGVSGSRDKRPKLDQMLLKNG